MPGLAWRGRQPRKSVDREGGQPLARPGCPLPGRAALRRGPLCPPRPPPPRRRGAQCRPAGAAPGRAPGGRPPAPQRCRAAAALCRAPAPWRPARAPRGGCGSPGRCRAGREASAGAPCGCRRAVTPAGCWALPGGWRWKGIFGILPGPGSGGRLSSACVLASAFPGTSQPLLFRNHMEPESCFKLSSC